MRSNLLISGFILWNIVAIYGQTGSSYNPFLINENDIIETRWKYVYTYHPSSQTVLHKAGDDYDYYLHFKYNHTFEEYLNGTLRKGPWSMDGRTLLYSHKHIEEYEIAEINNEQMILQFSQPNSTGIYQYHFISQTTKETPFTRPAYELPLVIVETDTAPEKDIQTRKKRGFFGWLFGWLKKDSDDLASEEAKIYLNIELIGGGYYGGIDPVVKDFVHIKNDGRLIHEFKSIKRGEIVTKGNINRRELEELVDYIELIGFFDFERIYDCKSSACQKRKRIKPKPTPLRLAVTKGQKKNVVTLPIYGSDDRRMKYLDYPKELDYIIETIQRMAARASVNPLAAQ